MSSLRKDISIPWFWNFWNNDPMEQAMNEVFLQEMRETCFTVRRTSDEFDYLINNGEDDFL
ncbi:MAG: hypothetical protein P8I57_06440 [Amylibacter sp.]|nr:hypothetical protein [Amylibacter sp.]|tara:strand:- start:113 stop:295 length:183 start_codon:yes stop_codon:yes gene_type:complete